ncbi:MAG: glycosyltransferase family 4 protein [Archaeoglobus sp.]|nr:glycosyltransferase family 4 protein [Archaeoglobus sp.]
MDNLRVCLIGDISGNVDEGMKKITYNIFRKLSKNNEVTVLKPSELLSKKKEIVEFEPDVIHYITGPSMMSFILLKLVKLGLERTKTVVSITHPQYLYPKLAISYFKPDLALVQACDMEKLFKKLNIKTEYYPNGVDVVKFRPVNTVTKMKLREKYNVGETFVVLHVGNIRPGRNLYLLQELSKDEDIEIVVVTSTTIKKHKKVYNGLVKAGIKVIDSYVENIEEIYNLSDVYIFPVTSRPFAVDVPLSVMEAMACNLPVISTRFAGLPVFFPEGNGLKYVNDEKELLKNVYFIKEKLDNGSLEVNTRKKVLPFSWEKITKKLENIYLRLLNNFWV